MTRFLLTALLSLSTFVLSAQSVITGTVYDEYLEPFPGATVRFNNGTTTSDFNGEFKLEIRKFPLLIQVSSVGYKTETVEITSAEDEVNVILKEALALDEIVLSASRTPERVLESSPKPSPVAKLSKPKPKKSKLRTKTNKYSYYIQVISCISHECVNESRLQLKSLGYKTRVRTSSESSGIAEVLSTNVLGEEESAIMVKEINSNNPLAGHAYRKLAKNGFRVSMGLFP